MQWTSKWPEGSAGLAHTLVEGQLLEWGAPALPQMCLRFWVSSSPWTWAPTDSIYTISKDP